jgi:hypothetical protein
LIQGKGAGQDFQRFFCRGFRLTEQQNRAAAKEYQAQLQDVFFHEYSPVESRLR